jgi:hypothetical protein
MDYRCGTPRLLLAIRGSPDHDHTDMIEAIMLRLFLSFVVLFIVLAAVMVWRRRRLIWNCEDDDREEDEERRMSL